jgi:hypothetical protein
MAVAPKTEQYAYIGHQKLLMPERSILEVQEMQLRNLHVEIVRNEHVYIVNKESVPEDIIQKCIFTLGTTLGRLSHPYSL